MPDPVSAKIDFATTNNSNEWVVSARLAELIDKHGLTGCTLAEVVSERNGRPNTQWYQVLVTEHGGEAGHSTRFGNDFFHGVDEQYVCRKHDLRGANIVSELYLRRSECPPTDLFLTKTRVGIRSGHAVPCNLLVISRAFADLLTKHRLKGYRLEVVHLFDMVSTG